MTRLYACFYCGATSDEPVPIPKPGLRLVCNECAMEVVIDRLVDNARSEVSLRALSRR